MKVSLNFEFDSNEAAEAFLRQVRERATQVAQQEQPVEPAKAKRRGRKSREQDDGDGPTPHQEVAPVPQPAADPMATKEDAQAALEKVFAAKGLATARDLLSRFGVQRLQDMPAEKYAEFIGHAERVLAGEAV